MALRLNELAEAEIARAHHGSLAREERSKVEELLKAGELPCLVATSSLELGIDMGAVDLVLQIESPKSVARGLQRIGRAGHGVDQVSRGRIFPKFRGDLLECAVVARRMHEGLIEPTVVPRNALDVLAQQIVAIAVAAEPASAGPSTTSADEDGHAGVAAGVSVDELHALVTSTHSYSELSRELLENVLDMLDGRYPSKEFGELRARIVWDRVAGTIRARRGSRQLAVANAGTIPDRGLFTVTLPDGRRVGELDEEMVYEARPGQAFLLGASTWRIEEITRDRVIVTPAPGAPGAVPFWKGDSVGRPKELGEAIGAFTRWAVDQDSETLQRDYDLDERAAGNLLAYLREQQAATRVLPSERTIVLERFRDEIGDWRLCVLSPYGGRVHAAWALALSARIRERFDLEADVISSDDGIILHLPELDSEEADALPSAAELVLIEPDEVERAVTAELGGSALFGARFRENASRALLIPRAYPGRRTPLWQQRLKAQNLLEVASRYADFPIILETYRECLKDVLDVPGLRNAAARVCTPREISLVEVETPTASPFASSLLFDYVATYMYEGDTPNAERRAAALSLDRDLLRELLGQEELRELIDPGALARVEDDLQHRSELTARDGPRRAARRAAPRRRPRPRGGLGARVRGHRRSRDAGRARARTARRAAARRRRGALHRRRRGRPLPRRARPPRRPGGLPEAFLEDVPDALRVARRALRTHARAVHDRGAPRALRRGRGRGPARARALGRARARRAAPRRQRARVVRRRGSAPPPPRLAGGPAQGDRAGRPAQPRGLPALLAGRRPPLRRRAPGSTACARCSWALQGLALPVEIWERDVLPRRTGAYSQSWLDSLCASGELVWVGAGPLGRTLRARRPVLPRRRAVDRAAVRRRRRPAPAARRPIAPEHELLRARLTQGPCFFTDLLAELDAPAEALRVALWDLVWAGEATNDAWAPLRAPHLALARGDRSPRPATAATACAAGIRERPRRARAARASARAGPPGTVRPGPAGAGTLVAHRAGLPRRSADDPAERRRALASCCSSATGSSRASRCSRRAIRGGFAILYDAFSDLETLGVCRRGYFIEGMGGAQFALPGAVERLRAARGAAQAPARARALVIAAADPAQPYGAALPWPKREGLQRRPARVAGAYVVLVGRSSRPCTWSAAAAVW